MCYLIFRSLDLTVVFLSILIYYIHKSWGTWEVSLYSFCYIFLLDSVLWSPVCHSPSILYFFPSAPSSPYLAFPVAYLSFIFFSSCLCLATLLIFYLFPKFCGWLLYFPKMSVFFLPHLIFVVTKVYSAAFHSFVSPGHMTYTHYSRTVTY